MYAFLVLHKCQESAELVVKILGKESWDLQHQTLESTL